MTETRQVELWIAAARSGDRAAFARLADEYNRAVASVIMAELLCSADELQDLLQEIWLAAWTGLPKLHDDARFAPWLFSITRNRTRTARKRRGRDQAHIVPATPDDDRAPGPLETAEASAESDPATAVAGQHLMRDALRQLPPKERVAFYLRVVVEPPWEYEMIAAALGAAEISVRVAYSRACKRLAVWWNRELAA